jgi:hypothetical protein
MGRQVGFVPLNIYDPESLQLVLSHVDNAIQYGRVPRAHARHALPAAARVDSA